MPDFFPIGKKRCGDSTECSASLGVWGYDCCGNSKSECCGSMTLGGWIAVGAVGALIILVILILVCKKR